MLSEDTNLSRRDFFKELGMMGGGGMNAYAETCASIANVYWNYRMFLATGDSKYYDVLERALYNGVISGVSLSGDKFFYDNPLESMGQHQRAPCSLLFWKAAALILMVKEHC